MDEQHCRYGTLCTRCRGLVSPNCARNRRTQSSGLRFIEGRGAELEVHRSLEQARGREQSERDDPQRTEMRSFGRLVPTKPAYSAGSTA